MPEAFEVSSWAGKPVTAKDGSKGLFTDVQPENEAVLRWQSGHFNEDDLKFANQWREAAKLHRQLAPFILNADQSFVERQEMQEALMEMAAARKSDANSEPSEDSPIYRLWMKHWRKPPHQAIQRPISEEESRQIMERMKPILEALQEQKRKQGPRFPV